MQLTALIAVKDPRRHARVSARRHDFVPYEQIDPIYFRHTYYVGPQDGAEKVYALLTRAMDESGLAGITKFIMRDRQNLGCLRLRDGMPTLEQMYFADEIRPLTELRPGKARVDRREFEMALQLSRDLARPPATRRLMTDNALRYGRSRAVATLLAGGGIRHIRTPP